MPRPPTVDQHDLLRRLLGVFRAKGYEAATMADLAAASGLAKPGLYHRFPGGKQEMAQAVLDDLRAWSARNLLAPLVTEGDPAPRVAAFVEALRTLYAGGHEACLLGAFSLGEPLVDFGDQLRRSIGDLIAALAGLASQAGRTPDEAQQVAEDIVVRIQGSLVVARIQGDVHLFERLLADIPALLLAGPGRHVREGVGQG